MAAAIPPFAFVKDIGSEKTDLMRPDGSHVDPAAEKAFSAFLAARAFSNYPDTIFAAHQATSMHHAPKLMAHDYLMGAVRRRKRPHAWNKKDDAALAEDRLVAGALGLGLREVRAARRVLGDRFTMLLEDCSRGGKE